VGSRATATATTGTHDISPANLELLTLTEDEAARTSTLGVRPATFCGDPRRDSEIPARYLGERVHSEPFLVPSHPEEALSAECSASRCSPPFSQRRVVRRLPDGSANGFGPALTACATIGVIGAIIGLLVPRPTQKDKPAAGGDGPRSGPEQLRNCAPRPLGIGGCLCSVSAPEEKHVRAASGRVRLRRVNREQISRLAHADHPIAAPLDDDSVYRLLERGISRGDGRILDLGCGGGEWLVRALTTHPRLRAEGVDISERSLAHARKTARVHGVQERLALHHEDAAGFTASRAFDLVLSVGATHAFGGLLPTLTAARKHLAPGARVLIGDGFWVHEPCLEAVEMLGDLADLPTTVDRVIADGWTPVYGHISTRRELDDYEWAWTGALASWALDHPDDPDSSQALQAATTHRDQWLRVYRDALGFLCLILRTSG
jgi:SAM-dependent methyltransferase